MDAKSLVEDFELFDDWEDRYGYLIDLGKRLPPLKDSERSAENKVNGCLSQVWFVQDEAGELLRFRGDSDAAIVRGLIGILYILFDGVPLSEASKVPVEEVFEKIGLSGHLSANRRNGFIAMVQRLRSYR